MKLHEYQSERLNAAWRKYQARLASVNEAKGALDDLCTVIAGPGWTLGTDEDGELTLTTAGEGEE